MTKETLNVASIGEEITGAEAGRMISGYREKHPANAIGYQVGRNILMKILNQQGCEGIAFYNSLDEMNRQTLVYVGVDALGQVIRGYSVVGHDGSFSYKPGIVADRLKPPAPPPGFEDWGLPE